MDKRFAGPSSENSARSANKTKFGIEDLKKVKVVINRKLPPAKQDQVLHHDVDKQDAVKIIRFPEEDWICFTNMKKRSSRRSENYEIGAWHPKNLCEGKRPIFEREDIVVNKEHVEEDRKVSARSSKHHSESETNRNETSKPSRRYSEDRSDARRSYSPKYDRRSTKREHSRHSREGSYRARGKRERSNSRRRSREGSYHGRSHHSPLSDRDRDRPRSSRYRSSSRRRYNSPSRAGTSRRSRSHELRRSRHSRSKSRNDRRRSRSVDRGRRRRSRSPRYRRSLPRRRSRDRNHELVPHPIDYAGAIGFLPNFMPPHELYLPNHPRGPVPPLVRFPPGMIPHWGVYRPQMYGMRPFAPPYRPHMMPPRPPRPRPNPGSLLGQKPQ